ncbi:hypothetical protein ACVIJ6_000605 [Bradyrhizobium sp. USDA 4369]
MAEKALTAVVQEAYVQGVSTRSGSAHDAKLRRDPIQHLADALADQMESSATAATNPVLHVRQDVFAWQMIGQRTISRRSFCFWSDLRLRFLDATNITVEILKTECKLIGIEALEAAAELHSLQLFDDGFETLDLGVAMVDRSGNVAHQALQKVSIGRETGEIDLHVRWYSNMLIRRRIATQFNTNFCRSSCNRRLPDALRRAPVDAAEQHAGDDAVAPTEFGSGRTATSDSRTIASFSSSVNRRRFARPSRGSSVKLVSQSGALAALLTTLLTMGRAEG